MGLAPLMNNSNRLNFYPAITAFKFLSCHRQRRMLHLPKKRHRAAVTGVKSRSTNIKIFSERSASWRRVCFFVALRREYEKIGQASLGPEARFNKIQFIGI